MLMICFFNRKVSIIGGLLVRDNKSCYTSQVHVKGSVSSYKQFAIVRTTKSRQFVGCENEYGKSKISVKPDVSLYT